MSNSDWPGPHWQQNDAGAGWRSGQDGLPQEHSPWDDNAGFWRAGREAGSPPSGPAGDRARRPSRHAASGPASGGRRADRGDYAAGGRYGRFSQTADDLRNRLGIRSSASGRDRGADRQGAGEFWDDPQRPAGRGGRTDWDGGRTESWQEDGGRTGYRGARRSGSRTGFDDTAAASRTAALRERTIGFGGGNGRGGGGRRPGFDRGPQGSGGGFKQWLLYGSWWRHWTLKKALGVAGGAVAAFILLVILGLFIVYQMTPIPTAKEQTANWQSSTVLFANGKQMGVFDGSVNGQSVERLLLTDSQIPKHMTDAMIAAEDRHFYTEGGISVTGLMRAAYEDIFGNGNLQGGSTITMQYAKNYYKNVNTGQNLSTKLKEVFIAMKLGHKESKSWVMTNYLNTVPFGPTTDGLGAAALNYFDINLTQPGKTLSVAQAAMLAALPNAPGAFSTDPHAGAAYTNLVARFHYVLTNMWRDGAISQSAATTTKFPAITPPPNGNGEVGYTGYLMQMVEQELEAPKADGGYGMSQQYIDTAGLRIKTTFSQAKVNALAKSVKAEIAQMRALGAPFHMYDRIGAVLEDPKTGAITAVYGGPGYGTKHCAATSCQFNTAEAAEQVGSSFKPYVLSTAVNEGMNVFTSKLNGYAPIWIPVSTTSPSVTASQIQTMLSPLSPPSGVSQQAVGGYSNGVYFFKFAEPAENSNRPLPVNVAAAISSDPAFEDLAHRDGIDNIIAMAKAFGVGQNPFVDPCEASGFYGAQTVPATIKDCNDMTGVAFKNKFGWHAGNGLLGNFSTRDFTQAAKLNGTPGAPTIALGQNPLTPVEQATTFATLADDGLYHSPHVIASMSVGGKTIAPNIITRQVLSPKAAANVDWALSFDNNMSGATAYVNVPFRRGGVIGKTGTLGQQSTSSQAWFIGATPDQEAMSVALFTNLPGAQVLNNLPSIGGTPGSQGGGWPATIWNNFMMSQFANKTASPMFQTQNSSPFQTWIQVKPRGLPRCKPGQFRNCKQVCQQGHGNGNGNGNGNGGNGPCPGNPNPGPTCGTWTGQPCHSTPPPTPTPSPSSTCGGFAQPPCSSPSPTPSGSPSPSCTPSPGNPCTAASGGGAAARRGNKAASTPAVTTAAITDEAYVFVASGPLRAAVSGG